MFAVLTVLVVVGGLVVFAGARTHRNLGGGYVAPSFTYTPPTFESTAAYPTAETTTTRAAPTTRSTAARPTTTKPAGPQPVAATVDNPLFRDPESGLINISCDYPRWGANVAAAKAFFEAARDCLDQMWRPVLKAANLPFATPNLSVTASAAGISTPCTGDNANWAAFYCSANQTIYMPLDHVFINENPNDSVIFLAVFAHEYGHHVQTVAGIMDKAHRDRYDAGTRTPRGLELSRRTELEAQCFGGMFIGSSTFVGTIDRDQMRRTVDDNYGRGDKAGDSRDHGSKQNYGDWYAHGVENNRTQKCNTWNSPPNSVS
ncbi:neutral zinc metallopeptidase [Nocardia sp. NPDC004068]|uniref:neutral zinc metallopeptidase n=1 Tax=Nocardia sp. NPDC004068 TaxID=3364303 RepID=UPI0036C04FD3